MQDPKTTTFCRDKAFCEPIQKLFQIPNFTESLVQTWEQHLMEPNGNDLDLMSSLPDEILYKIASFLPSESVLQTIFLSTRWRKLWKEEILVQNGALEDVADAASKFLLHFNEFNPLKHPRRLQYQFGNGRALLVSVVASDKLHLDFSFGNQDFPSQFGWQLSLNYHQPSQSTFFVKTLCLKSVTRLTTEAVSSLVSSICSIENLKLIECNALQSFSVTSGSKLQSLIILDCLQLEFLHIGCSKLRSFRYRGLFPRIRLENHFNMEDVMLDCRQGPVYIYKSNEFDPILLTVKNVRTLTLCKWTFEALIFPSLSWNFKFYNLKDLWWIDDSKGKFNANALIAFLKLCPALERLFVTFDSESYRILSSDAFSKNTNGDVQLGQLKVVILKGFASQEDEISSEEQLSIAESDGNLLLSYIEVPPCQLKSQGERDLEMANIWPEKIKDFREYIKKPFPKHSHMDTWGLKF